MAASDVYKIGGYTVRLVLQQSGGVVGSIRGGTGQWTAKRYWKDAPLLKTLSGLDGSLTLQKARDWIQVNPMADADPLEEQCVTEREMYPWESQAMNPSQERLLKQQQMLAAAQILNATDCYTSAQVKERLLKLQETEHPDNGGDSDSWERIVSAYQFLKDNLPVELPQRRTTHLSDYLPYQWG